MHEPEHEAPDGPPEDPGRTGPLAAPLAGTVLVGAAFAIHRWLTADPDAPC